MAISDRIIVMKKGLVDQVADPKTIYYHPVDEFVADFIGEANFLHGTLAGKSGDEGVALVEGQEIEVAGVGDLEAGSKVTLVLRPEAAHLADEGKLPCEVVLSRFMGHYQNYHVRCGDHVVKITEFNPKNKHEYQVGDHAFVRFEKDDLHALAQEG